MTDDVLCRRDRVLVRRLRLAAGEATPWHRDPYHRISVIIAGDALNIEFRDGGTAQRIEVSPGQVDTEEPCEHMHRAVNSGRAAYEEITIFLLDQPDDVPQPGDA
jgi:hypothetical protein